MEQCHTDKDGNPHFPSLLQPPILPKLQHISGILNQTPALVHPLRTNDERRCDRQSVLSVKHHADPLGFLDWLVSRHTQNPSLRSVKNHTL